jgi:hypothetical protein
MSDGPVPLLDHRLRARLERVELISALGVLTFGIGIGALFAVRLRPIAPEFGKPLWWVEVLNRLCWLLLLALTAYLA